MSLDHLIHSTRFLYMSRKKSSLKNKKGTKPIWGVLFIVSSSIQAAPFPQNPIHPSQSILSGAGRFGEGRSGDVNQYGSRPHAGVDINASRGTPLYAVSDGVVITSGNTGGGTGNGVVIKLNNSDVIASYWHLTSIDPSARVRAPVKKGQIIGYSGNTNQAGTTTGSYAYHLHFGVGLPSPKQTVAAWLHNRPRNGAQVVSSTAMTTAMTYGGKAWYWTNPAPYMQQDVIITVSPKFQPDKLVPFIGNSIRTQYNALTGANLPISGNVQRPTRANELPKLMVSSEGVPSSVASESGQMQMVGAIASGNADELLGQDSVTMSEFSFYAKPRTIFSGESTVQLDVGDGNLTKTALIEKIGNSRFANATWQSDLVGLSMRGMLIEYLNMINAENFLIKESLFQQERIESLYAAWSSNVTKYNMESELQESIEKAQTATAVPEVSTIPVEDIYEIVENGGAITGGQLSNTVTLGSEKEVGKCNPKYKDYFNALPDQVKKELVAFSFRLGFHPLDYLNMTAVETGFNSNNDIYKGSYTYKDSKGVTRTAYPAGGFIQLTPTGASGIPYAKVMELFPQSRTVLTNALGSSITAKNKAKNVAHGVYLKQLQNINPRLEFAIYDAYFWSKNNGFVAQSGREKNVAKLYRMIFGGPYKEGTRGYAENSQYDLNHDGIITVDEPVMHPMFTSRRCMYITNEEILTNKLGLTNEDLKLIPWDESIKRLKSPTVGDYGGHFAFSQSFSSTNK